MRTNYEMRKSYGQIIHETLVITVVWNVLIIALINRLIAFCFVITACYFPTAADYSADSLLISISATA